MKNKKSSLQLYDKPILVGQGGMGSVYRISDRYVAKVRQTDSNRRTPEKHSISFLEKEHEIGCHQEIQKLRILYSYGSPIPEPITIDYVDIENEGLMLGLIMEYIEGDAIKKLGVGNDLKNLIKSHSSKKPNVLQKHMDILVEQIERLKTIGFIHPLGVDEKMEFIYNPNLPPIYQDKDLQNIPFRFIDLMSWESLSHGRYESKPNLKRKIDMLHPPYCVCSVECEKNTWQEFK